MFEPVMIFWAMIGAAVGALIAALVARVQLVSSRRELVQRVRARDASIERLKGTLGELTSRQKRLDEQLAELAELRRDRPAMATGLEEAQRTIADLRQAVESARATGRETEMRFTASLDAERNESAARRAALAAESVAARESALNLRAELASARDAASRTAARLEADLAASRLMLERTAAELHAERAEAVQARSDLSRRLRALDEDRQRLEADLAAERRGTHEKIASLRSYVNTLKEQYALAATERDAAAREAEVQRTRAADTARLLDAAREEYAARLDVEHVESVNLLSRVWDYVHNYPRLRERPVTERDEEIRVVEDAAVPPAAAPTASAAPVEAMAAPAEPPVVTEQPPVVPVHAPPPPGALRPAAGPEPAARAHPMEREVPVPPAFLADAAAQGPAYDIERELADVGPSRALDQPRPIHTFEGTRVRRPISAMRRENDVLVICDDGTVWSKRANGWVQEVGIPGTEQDVVRRLDDTGRSRE